MTQLALPLTRKGRRLAKPPSPKELAIHVPIAQFLDRFIVDGWEYTHIPAGELRTKRTAAKLRAMGTKAGWPDIVLIGPFGTFHGLELKRPGRPLNEAQAAFHQRALSRGWNVATADSIDGALAILGQWGALKIKLGGPA